MPTTPRGAPYPAGTDPTDVPGDLQALADWADARPGVATVTTAQRDALAGVDLWTGRVVWNTTTSRLQTWTGSAWADLDHNALGNLTTGDPHTQYLTDARGDARYPLRSTLTTKGDLYVRDGSALTRLPVGSNNQVLTADSAQPLGVKWAAAAAPTGGLTVLASQTLASPAASITFSSIPGTYQHLWLTFLGATDGSSPSALLIRFNGSSATDYERQTILGSGTTASAAATGTSSIDISSLVPPTSGGWLGVGQFLIPNYATTATYKALTGTYGSKWASPVADQVAGTVWGWFRSTAAVTSITLLPASNNFATGTRAVLYGTTT